MTIFSTLCALADLACDIGPALRRFAAPPVDDADPYAERLARAHAELPAADCGLGEAGECLCDEDGAVCGKCWPGSEQTLLLDATLLTGGITSESPPSAADEPAFIAWLASVDARLAAIQNHLTSAAPGATFTPDATPESPAPDTGAGAGHPGFPNWCAAEMRQVADILLNADSPFALGYANDLRSAADALGNDDPGSERVSWPWPEEIERRK